MNDDVHMKNAKALAEVAKKERARADGLENRLKQLEAQVVQHQAVIASLQQRMAVMQVRDGGATSGD